MMSFTWPCRTPRGHSGCRRAKWSAPLSYLIGTWTSRSPARSLASRLIHSSPRQPVSLVCWGAPIHTTNTPLLRSVVLALRNRSLSEASTSVFSHTGMDTQARVASPPRTLISSCIKIKKKRPRHCHSRALVWQKCEGSRHTACLSDSNPAIRYWYWRRTIRRLRFTRSRTRWRWASVSGGAQRVWTRRESRYRHVGQKNNGKGRTEL